jgi:hypothetical protein
MRSAVAARWMVVPCVLCIASALSANPITYTAAGSDLNLATTDGTNIMVGVTQLFIPVTDLYVVSSGDSVAVTLNGLQYPYAGDLRVTLTLVDSMDNILATGDVFDRIGKTSNDPNDFGYSAQFGNSGTIDSGNYVFDSGFTGLANDLWATAASQGSSDSIPSGNYWATGMYSSSNDNLSSQFANLAVKGTWVLTIYDYYPPFSGPAPFTPGITSWGLTIQTTAVGTAPEPSAAIPVALSLSLLCWITRRRACV